MSYPKTPAEARQYALAIASFLREGGVFVGFNNNPHQRTGGAEYKKYGFIKRHFADEPGAEDYDGVPVEYDIDDLGDEYVKAPHVYAPFAPGRRGPFKSFIAEVATIGRWDRRSFNPNAELDGRIEYFPADLRESNDDSK